MSSMDSFFIEVRREVLMIFSYFFLLIFKPDLMKCEYVVVPSLVRARNYITVAWFLVSNI